MHFSSSLLSSAILIFGYLTNAALCVPTDEPSNVAVNNNQQLFHSTGNSTATKIDLLNLLIPWMRAGLDPNVNYGVYFRNFMLDYTGTLSIDAFNTIVQSANSINNVFSINSGLNSYKSNIALSKYVGDPRIHLYLCSDFTTDRTLVWQRAQATLDGLINDANPSVKAIGTRINNAIALRTLRCP